MTRGPRAFVGGCAGLGKRSPRPGRVQLQAAPKKTTTPTFNQHKGLGFRVGSWIKGLGFRVGTWMVTGVFCC